MIQRSIQKKREGQGGFTLVELLIVIVILGILAAIVVLAIGGLKNTSQSAACNSGAKTLESAEDAYYAIPTGAPGNGGGGNYGTTAQLAGAGLLKGGAPADLVATAPTTQTYDIAGVAGSKCAGTHVTGP